jgi:mycofactocin system transcriptional regulator
VKPRAKPTTVEAIEKAALEVFAERGFDEPTVEEIAAAAGISRRTFFRYFASKNDIPFGNFAYLLRDLEQWFSTVPDDRPMFEVIEDAILRFNRVASDGDVAHRERMKLILHTPALRANSALRHAEWLAVVARYAARRMGGSPDDLGPLIVAHISQAASSAAYEQWLRDESSDLAELVHRAFTMAQNLPELAAGTTPKRGRRAKGAA